MKLALAVVSLVVVSSGVRAASFDCARAATPDERAICADKRLSMLDTVAAAGFASARQGLGASEVVRIGREFMADRRRCGAEASCIMASYVAVIGTYKNLGGTVELPDWADATAIAGGDARPSVRLPTAVGQCVATRVAEVAPRLDPGRRPRSSDFDAGTGVNFKNGGYQVTYERQETILQSRPGDEVVMCLTSVPRGCPPGDVRGRTYITTNLRTRGTWWLPDSQHGCGGA